VASTKAIFDFLNWPVTEQVEIGVLALTGPDRAKVNKTVHQNPFSILRDHKTFDPSHWRKELTYEHAKRVQETPACAMLMRKFNYTGVLQ
jgi:hypothetical protein